MFPKHPPKRGFLCSNNTTVQQTPSEVQGCNCGVSIELRCQLGESRWRKLLRNQLQEVHYPTYPFSFLYAGVWKPLLLVEFPSLDLLSVCYSFFFFRPLSGHGMVPSPKKRHLLPRGQLARDAAEVRMCPEERGTVFWRM